MGRNCNSLYCLSMSQWWFNSSVSTKIPYEQVLDICVLIIALRLIRNPFTVVGLGAIDKSVTFDKRCLSWVVQLVEVEIYMAPMPTICQPLTLPMNSSLITVCHYCECWICCTCKSGKWQFQMFVKPWLENEAKLCGTPVSCFVLSLFSSAENNSKGIKMKQKTCWTS